MTPLRTHLAVAALVALTLLSPQLYDVAHAEDIGYDAVYAAAANAFGPGYLAHRMTRIARCESGRDPGAWSGGYDAGWGVYYDFVGLVQIDWVSHARRARAMGFTRRDLYDPYVNMLVAKSIFDDQGLNAWPYCSRFA